MHCKCIYLLSHVCADRCPAERRTLAASDIWRVFFQYILTLSSDGRLPRISSMCISDAVQSRRDRLAACRPTPLLTAAIQQRRRRQRCGLDRQFHAPSEGDIEDEAAAAGSARRAPSVPCPRATESVDAAARRARENYRPPARCGTARRGARLARRKSAATNKHAPRRRLITAHLCGEDRPPLPRLRPIRVEYWAMIDSRASW